MKKFVLFTCVLILAFSVAGYSGISTISAETAPKEIKSGENWKFNFELVDGSNKDKKHNYVTKGNRTNISGVLTLNNGCVQPGHSFNKTGEDSFELNVFTIDNSTPDTFCTQEIRYQGYEASLEAETPYTLTLNVEGNETEIVNKRKDDKRNFFRFIEFILGLF